MFNHQLHAALWSGQHLTFGEIKSYESYYWEQQITERSIFFGRTHHKEEKLNHDLSIHLSLTSLGTVYTCIQHKIIFVIKIIKVTSFHGNDISYSAVIHGLTLCIILAKLKSWGFNATQVFLLSWKCARLSLHVCSHCLLRLAFTWSFHSLQQKEEKQFNVTKICFCKLALKS